MAEEKSGAADRFAHLLDGGFGIGLVLIFLPGVALVLGAVYLERSATMALPVLAIFGIMILFGALSLVATLFSRLGLSDTAHPLALPQGSIRAAIALSLVVLFAIISIMLYQSISEPYVVRGLQQEQKERLVDDMRNRVIAAFEYRCSSDDVAAKRPGCSAAGDYYEVHLLQPPWQESTDLAKQLLILIGTLMTSVTSFYFAARSGESSRDAEGLARAFATVLKPVSDVRNGGAAADGRAGKDIDAGADSHEHLDGCDLPIGDAVSDEDLPRAEGGVA